MELKIGLQESPEHHKRQITTVVSYKYNTQTSQDVTMQCLEKDFVVLTLIPYLPYADVVNFLSMTKEVKETYDNDKVWNGIVPQLKNIGYVRIKKCIHFMKLAKRMSAAALIDEVTNQNQWIIIMLSLGLFQPGGGRMKFKAILQRLYRSTKRGGGHIYFPEDVKTLAFVNMGKKYCALPGLKRRKTVSKALSRSV